MVGVALTTYEVMDERTRMLAVLLEVFAEVGSEHCIIGGIAVGYHGRLRATVDVDMLVPKQKLGRIADRLGALGYLVVRHTDMVRVYAPGADPARDVAIADLVEREANPTLREAARVAERATVLDQPAWIVPRGALVALKFQAAISPSRRIGDRYIDVGDIDRIVQTKFDDDDEALALRIAETIYPGARDDLAQMLDDLRHNRPVHLTPQC